MRFWIKANWRTLAICQAGVVVSTLMLSGMLFVIGLNYAWHVMPRTYCVVFFSCFSVLFGALVYVSTVTPLLTSASGILRDSKVIPSAQQHCLSAPGARDLMVALARACPGLKMLKYPGAHGAEGTQYEESVRPGRRDKGKGSPNVQNFSPRYNKLAA